MVSELYAPSYAFLYSGSPPAYAKALQPQQPSAPTLTDRELAWVGADSGFLPLVPLSRLPGKHIAWEQAAARLPETCRKDAWQSFIEDLPTITANNLADQHLPKANLCLGAMAHAIKNIAQLPVPECILSPWFQIADRLGNPSTSLPYHHIVICNFTIVSRTSPSATPKVNIHWITDPLSQTEPPVTLTGSRTERNFWNGIFSIEHTARPLPGILARAQQAVISSDDASLRSELINLIQLLDRMTSMLLRTDARPLSEWCVDPVDFSRSVDATAYAIISGENTASGTQSPSIHILDAFFERPFHSARLSQVVKREQLWFPRLHRDLLTAVGKVSVLDYLESLPPSQERRQLLHLYMKALESFADENGFLGKHRLRLMAFIELGNKIGRLQIGSGLIFPEWKGRVWYKINDEMEGVRQERMHRCKTLYHSVSIRSSTPAGRNNSFAQRIVFETDGAVLYKPGDVICILPENREEVITEVLTALNINGTFIVKIKAKAWLQNLLDRGIENDRSAQGPSTTLTVSQLMRYASLKALNSETLCRLHDSITSVCSGDTNVDSILEPLQARSYSIASSAKVTSKNIEILVGRTEYTTSTENISYKLSMSTAESRVPGMKNVQDFEVSHSAQCRTKHSSKTETEQLNPNLMDKELMSMKLIEDGQHSNGKDVPDILLASLSGNTEAKQNKLTVVQGISSSFLSTSSPGAVVRARVIPKVRFRLPREARAPIVMIGLGTGITPFMSFIKEFVHEKRVTGQVRQKAWLVLGVRTPDHIPFLDELEEAVCKHKVVQLSIACSRADVEFYEEESQEGFVFRPGSRKRVQNLFWDDPGKLHRLWNTIAANGHVYLCGKPQLEPFIRKAIADAARQFGKRIVRAAFPDTMESAEALSNKFPYLLAAQHRLHISTYNGGRQSHSLKYVLPSEVAENRSMGSCFVSFRGLVYDLTAFLKLHPGGAKILFDKAGRDITEDFNIAHGKDSGPMVAMIEPYRIGLLYRFPESCCDRILTLMREWSLPLLHGVLEHRSVFLMDVNDFPELELLQSNARWTSQLSSNNGQVSICRNFWKTHEVQLFKYIIKEVSPDRIGKVLRYLSTSLVGASDLRKLQQDITASRDAAVKTAKERGAEPSKPKTKDFLLECGEFMDNAVQVFVRVQSLVESALRKSASETSFLSVYRSLSEGIVETVTTGMDRGYAILPLDYFC